MTAFRLWSDEIEAMRAEARAAVDAGRDAMMLDTKTSDGLSREKQLAAQRESMAAVTFPLPDTEERVLGGVPCRVLLPEAAPRAVYLHFHGGAMVAGSAAMMDFPNRDLVNNTGVAVVSVEYRKAPEFPWPAGPDDGLAVSRELLDHAAADLGSERLLIGGESAGGYLAAAVALRIRDELGAIDRVDGLNLTYGVFDWGRTPSQRGMRANTGFDVLSAEALGLAADSFLPGRTDDERRDPAMSPAFADLHGLPPCLVTVGTCDHLLDDSLLFAARAAAAEVDVDLLVLPELPHAFQMFDCGLTRLWSRRVLDWMAARLG
jgi:acetyl esterase